MLIREINHYPEMKTKSATVELTYDELRDISNALYECSKTHDKYHQTRTKMFILFEIVKNGSLDCWAIEKLYEMTHQGEEE